ncbi:MAG: pantoate--beta-alanine ligase, partial [Deltaproteobacteria bacterium]|nr:pantoate--beta-alanine ligase [Deltaproteobacteria bacterium]
VCTIVSKLLHIVNPDRLYLGMKDAQQLRIIVKMVEDLFFPVQVVPAATVREDDGLACSSRNNYLDTKQREIAPVLFQALQQGQQTFENGERDTTVIIGQVRSYIEKYEDFRIQYIDLLDWETFAPRRRIENKSILALACYLGQTRLIDNVFLLP